MEIKRENSNGRAKAHTHPCDILNGTGHSEASAAGCSQPEVFSVKLLAGALSQKVIKFYLHSYWSVNNYKGITGASSYLLYMRITMLLSIIENCVQNLKGDKIVRAYSHLTIPSPILPTSV